MPSKADVHVHSKYSDRPSEWILRRIGAPESFVEPLEIYRRCRERGMEFVTISDHNCIQGALEIAHLDGTFISTEVTSYFPEDGAKIHCLVLGITEAQFEVIQQIRTNVYDFQRYVVDEDIVYSLAHPLFRVNDLLTVGQLEKLLLLFNRFELINGTRHARASDLVRLILSNLTPEMIADMADRHGLEPLGPEPWKKQFTAGSDDHSGIYMASAYTVTPSAESVEQFLEHLRRGEHQPGGTSGTSLRLAHSFYQIAYSYYKDRVASDVSQPSVLGDLFRNLFEQTQAPSVSFGEHLLGRLGQRQAAQPKEQLSGIEQTLVDEFSLLFDSTGSRAKRPKAPPDHEADQRRFQLACDIGHQLTFAFLQKCLKNIGSGEMLESLQTLASLAPVVMGVSPYLAAYRTQHKDEPFLRAVAAHFPATRHLRLRSDKKIWATDTIADVNGVSRTIQAVSTRAKALSRPLTVLTCLDRPPDAEFELKNFTPVGSFPMPEYSVQSLSLPPFLEVVDYLEREGFAEVIISTPGPLGLTALAAGRLLGLKVTGIYHTDFPRYVLHFTQDIGLEQLTWRYMLWFYGQMDTLFVPSQYYQRQLAERGFAANRLRVLERGVDLELFGPHRRQPDFFQRHHLPEGLKFLYVGRVSKEKNLDLLLDAFQDLLSQGITAQLAIVGDGPLLGELKQRYQRPEIAFTGILEGADLAQAYASADVFVFPSTTDTFGNAVLEAQASGLPAIVADRGGPPEIVRRFDSGVVVDVHQPRALAEAMSGLYQDPERRQELSQRALRNARESSWDRVLDDFWSEATPDQDEAPTHYDPQEALENAASLLALDVA